MNAEQFFNNGFGADVEKVHRKHVIELMTNFAKHYHTEQCNIANVVFSEAELNAKLEEQKEEIRQWLIDEDFEGLAERL